MIAAQIGNFAVAKVLLEAGADVLAKNASGISCREIAEKSRNRGLAELFVSAIEKKVSAIEKKELSILLDAPGPTAIKSKFRL